MARQGGGRRYGQQASVEALRAAVRHRRGLAADRKVAQQRLRDQLNALCPGLSAPSGHGCSLALDTPTGLAVLACAAAFSGRAPQLRSLMCRTPGRLRTDTASARVAARILGTKSDRINRGTEGRLDLALLIGAGAEAPLRMAPLHHLGRTACTAKNPECSGCPLKPCAWGNGRDGRTDPELSSTLALQR